MRKRALRLDELTALSSSMRRTTSADGDPIVTDDSEMRNEISKIERQIAELIEHIQQQGVEVKDIRRGLVDWRAERDGRVVYLCWQYGERTVSWWHELSDGFAGRQPILRRTVPEARSVTSSQPGAAGEARRRSAGDPR